MAPCNLQGFGTARGCPKGQAPTSLPPGSSPASLRALTGVHYACCMRQGLHRITAASGLLCVAGQRQLTPARQPWFDGSLRGWCKLQVHEYMYGALFAGCHEGSAGKAERDEGRFRQEWTRLGKDGVWSRRVLIWTYQTSLFRDSVHKARLRGLCLGLDQCIISDLLCWPFRGRHRVLPGRRQDLSIAVC